MSKPIKVFYDKLSGRFYASQHYKEDGNAMIITGKKYDVTNDIGSAVVKHDVEFIRFDSNPQEIEKGD